MVFRGNLLRISFDALQRLVMILRSRRRQYHFESASVSSSTLVAVYENVNATVPTPLNMIARRISPNF